MGKQQSMITNLFSTNDSSSRATQFSVFTFRSVSHTIKAYNVQLTLLGQAGIPLGRTSDFDKFLRVEDKR
jgi:hypothetical protein